jgi:hypothetical protein
MMRRLTSTALLTLSVLASTAMRPQQGADPRLVSRLDGRLREAVVAIVDSARRDGLPTEPLIDKALEGAAKRAHNARVTDAMIITSVSRLSGELRRARAALGPASNEAELKAGAEALKAGVEVQQLERMRAARGEQRIAMALDVLTYIVNLGVRADTASNVIVGLVLASASDEQLQSLRADIERDISGGTPAALAMSARGQGLQTQIAAQTTNSGAPGTGLPSPFGTTRPAGPGANPQLGGNPAVNAAPGGSRGGGSKPGPAGQPKKP